MRYANTLFKMHLSHTHIVLLEFNHIFGSSTTRQKYYAPQVRPDRGSNSRPPDHDSSIMSLRHLL